MVEHRIYAWHESKSSGITKPRNTSFNIKGVELEISDWRAGDTTDYLIEENFLTVPSNQHINKEHTIVVESDGSVDHELIIKACGNRKLFEIIKQLEFYYHDECNNQHGTSCHIHLNRKHLRSKGISETSIFKAVEFLYPILFRISGRDFHSTEWCKSYILHSQYHDNEEEEFDLLKIANKVDDIEYEDVEYCGRYYATNTENRNTIELRIFSNYYNFNSEYIKLYIELCDFIIDIAEIMGEEESYYSKYDELITMIKEFFGKRSRKRLFEKHNLDLFLLPANERKRRRFEELKNYLDNRIQTFENRSYENELQRLMSIIRIFRDLNSKYNIDDFNIKFKSNMTDEDILEIVGNIFAKIDEEIENL